MRVLSLFLFAVCLVSIIYGNYYTFLIFIINISISYSIIAQDNSPPTANQVKIFDLYYNHDRDEVQNLIDNGDLTPEEKQFARFLLKDSLTQEELDQTHTDIHEAFNNQ